MLISVSPRLLTRSLYGLLLSLLALALYGLLHPGLAPLDGFLFFVATGLCILVGVMFSAAIHRLRQSQQRLAVLFEQAPDGVFVADLSGTYTDVNSAACKMLGYTRDELVGMTIEDVILVSDRGRLQQSRQLLLDGGIDRACWQLRRKDGSVIDAEVCARILPGGIWQAFVRDITDRREIENELRSSRNRLRDMVHHHEIACEEERKHLSREIHDELGQVLSGLRMDVALLKAHAKDEARFQHTLNDMVGLIDQAFSVARQVMTSLRPAVLDLGLVASLEWLAQDFSRRTDTRCILHACVEHLPLGDAQAATIFRVVQESLTNVSRHAAAREVRVDLTLQDDVLSLRIKDDGQGFNPKEAVMGYGLLSMQERVLAMGGKFDLQSQPQAGTEIHITVPVRLLSSG